MWRYENGQALIVAVILLPLILTVISFGSRFFRASQSQSEAQDLCNQTALKAMEIQAKALTQLAKLNPLARTLAEARRAISLTALTPQGRMALESIKKTQAVLGGVQKSIQTSYENWAILSVRKALQKYREAFFNPFQPLAPHSFKESFNLHVRRMKSFKDMEGAPLELDDDFQSRQQLQITIPIPTSSGVLPVQCKAQLQMKELSSIWTAYLSTTGDKPSSKWRSFSPSFY